LPSYSPAAEQLSVVAVVTKQSTINPGLELTIRGGVDASRRRDPGLRPREDQPRVNDPARLPLTPRAVHGLRGRPDGLDAETVSISRRQNQQQEDPDVSHSLRHLRRRSRLLRAHLRFDNRRGGRSEATEHVPARA
jgi:hypothetical protein